MKFVFEASPKWLWTGLLMVVLGGLPFISAAAGTVTNDVISGGSEPEIITIQPIPTATPSPSPLPPLSSSTPAVSPTPTPVPSLSSTIIIESPPTVVVEPPDLSAILAAIAALGTTREPIDLEALADVIATAVADLEIIVEVTIGETTFTCDTRGPGSCESPPFGGE